VAGKDLGRSIGAGALNDCTNRAYTLTKIVYWAGRGPSCDGDGPPAPGTPRLEPVIF
jgi:hypothetical protein